MEGDDVMNLLKAVVLYARAIQAMIENGRRPGLLAGYDRIIISESCWHQLQQLPASLVTELVPRCLLYFNPWGKDRHTSAGLEYKPWQPGPGDEGHPMMAFETGGSPVYAYPQALAVHDKLCRQTARTLLHDVGTKHAAGAFFDDWSFHKRYWHPRPDTHEGATLRDIGWQMRDGHPGWRAGGDWNRSRLELLERGLRAFFALRDKQLVLNTNHLQRSATGTPVFIESIGPEPLDHGMGHWVTLASIEDQVNADDILHMRCLNADGTMVPRCQDTWDAMKKLAVDRGCYVARSYWQKPDDGGGSVYSNTEDPNTPDWLL